MDAQPESPNWHWQKLGCTIERVEPKRLPDGSMQVKRRIIRRPDGSIVNTGDGSHEAELLAATKEIGICYETK